MQADREALPELPLHVGQIVGRRRLPHDTDEFWGYFREGFELKQKEDVYTAYQMRDYLLADRAARAPEERSAEPFAFAIMLPGNVLTFVDSLERAERFRPTRSRNWAGKIVPLYATPPVQQQAGGAARAETAVDLTDDQRAAIEFYRLNPSAAVLDLRHRISPLASLPGAGAQVNAADVRDTTLDRPLPVYYERTDAGAQSPARTFGFPNNEIPESLILDMARANALTADRISTVIDFARAIERTAARLASTPSGEGTPAEWRAKAEAGAIEAWTYRVSAGPAAQQGEAICVHCSSPNTVSVRVIHCRVCGGDSVEPVAASEPVATGASSQPAVDDSPAPATPEVQVPEDVIERLDRTIAWLRDGIPVRNGIGVADMVVIRNALAAAAQRPAQPDSEEQTYDGR